ncbi:Protein of unknown function [Pyronema omphalodes CBS 100304]|uniref:Uncharacterized protein n=1 Tax=Pyronema omphalodes (strain CBS 100304) TaxID=1076935 RepID=U4L945_PYROM|nr:Protein of unknown function [Pyronema omphalodes CBS 100304]
MRRSGSGAPDNLRGTRPPVLGVLDPIVSGQKSDGDGAATAWVLRPFSIMKFLTNGKKRFALYRLRISAPSQLPLPRCLVRRRLFETTPQPLIQRLDLSCFDPGIKNYYDHHQEKANIREPAIGFRSRNRSVGYPP